MIRRFVNLGVVSAPPSSSTQLNSPTTSRLLALALETIAVSP